MQNLSPNATPHEPTAQHSGAPFSASLAMTFFAQHFIENVPHGSGTQAFCQPHVEVRSWKLVTELPIIAFWYLRENNCVRFASANEHGSFKNGVPPVIEFNPASQASFPGLEYDFLEIIKRSPSRETAGAIFRKFLGGHDPNPENKLIKRLIAWMTQLDYGQPDNSPKPFFRFSGRTHMFEDFVPDCQRIAAQEQAAQMIHQRWMKFRAEQPEVFYFLFDDIVKTAKSLMRNSVSRSSRYWHAEIGGY